MRSLPFSPPRSGRFVAGIVLFFIMHLQVPPAAAENDPSIKLVVTITVDQLRPDRLSSSMPGGLGRLLQQGRVYDDAYLAHAVTNTCPGHAAVLTGMNPSSHGIIGNEYFDRERWETRYCVADDSTDARVFGADAGRSPRPMKATTLGDWLKHADPSSRVVSLSAKDRAAVTLGGQQADLVFWFDATQGKMTTSRYYLDDMASAPAWIQSFNGTDPLNDGYLAGLPAQWVHPPGSFRPDDFHAEDDEFSRSSPHPLGSGDLAEVAEQFYTSPWSDRAIAALAIEAIESEALGQRGSTDLLALGFSAIDSIGHRYGPFSAEVEDALRALDTAIAELLDTLDRSVGTNNYVVVLTADHGVAPLPEWRDAPVDEQCEWDEGRATVLPLVLSMYGQLYWEFTFPFGNPFDLVAFSGPQIYVNDTFAREQGINPAEVIDWLETYLEALPYVEEAWRVDEIFEGDSPTAALYQHAWYPRRSGDLVIQNASGCLIAGEFGTTHGTPYAYDRRIPLVFMGPGISPTRVAGEEVHSIDIAPTLAKLLNLDRPVALDGKMLPLRGDTP